MPTEQGSAPAGMTGMPESTLCAVDDYTLARASTPNRVQAAQRGRDRSAPTPRVQGRVSDSRLPCLSNHPVGHLCPPNGHRRSGRLSGPRRPGTGTSVSVLFEYLRAPGGEILMRLRRLDRRHIRWIGGARDRGRPQSRLTPRPPRGGTPPLARPIPSRSSPTAMRGGTSTQTRVNCCPPRSTTVSCSTARASCTTPLPRPSRSRSLGPGTFTGDVLTGVAPLFKVETTAPYSTLNYVGGG